MVYNDTMKAKIIKLSLLLILLLFTLVIGFVSAYSLTKYNYDMNLKSLKIEQERQDATEFESFEKVKIEANILMYNDLRKNLGLQESLHDEKLCKFSDERLKDVTIDWSHNKEKINAYAKNNKDSYKVISENLADGKQTKQRGLLTPMVEWVSSKSHFQAMINPNYTRNCMSCSKDRCVLIMAQPQNP